jgi:hypothetical protein
VAERQIPHLGRARRERKTDQLGVVGLEGAGLGVEGDERRLPEALDERGDGRWIVDDDDFAGGTVVDGEPVGGGGGEGGGGGRAGRRLEGFDGLSIATGPCVG